MKHFLVCALIPAGVPLGYQGKAPGPKYLNSSYYYLLTDPAIMTKDGQYGVTDLGQPGIENPGCTVPSVSGNHEASPEVPIITNHDQLHHPVSP